MATNTQVSVYLRQSKWHQGSISMELQEAQCRALAEREGWQIRSVHRDDDTSGRSTENRPGLRALRAEYEAGGFDIAVAHSASRFARNLRDGAEIVGEMPIATVLEGIQDSKDDDFVPLLHMLMSHRASREIGKRWNEVLTRRINVGLPPSGGVRYGYDFTPASVTRSDGTTERTAPENVYTINEEQARHVRNAFSWYLQGSGFSTIASRLNEEGSRTVRGSMWGSTRLMEYMDSGFSAGYFRANGDLVRGVQTPIISEETWGAYRRRRNSRKKLPSRTKGSGWELQGIVFCDLCQGPMSLSGAADSRNARCSRHANSGAAACVGVSYLERSIHEQTGAFLARMVDQWAGILPDNSEDRERLRLAIDGLNTQITEVGEAQSRLIELYVSEDLDAEGYRLAKARQDSKRDDLRQQVAGLEDELDALGTDAPDTFVFDEWDVTGSESAARWQEQQREALRSLHTERAQWAEIHERMEGMEPSESRALYSRLLSGIYVGKESVRFVARDGSEETMTRLAPKKKGVVLSNKAAPGVHRAARAWAQAQGQSVNLSGAVSEDILSKWETATGNDRSVTPS